ncbi:MAG: bifunctional UDP-4-keto-pentose/UDP-xylose synthase [Acidobacteriia bacterium]|nr:bifunctional UDP-4-keto-pentose/UDP-xylose synthase [Terriglobia bacterium]
MKILTLGAAGFIGSHLTHRLLQEGHAVVAVDLTIEKVAEYLDHPNLTFLQQDIRRPEWDLDGLAQDADLVIDLIAYANPGLYLRIPLEVFRLNFTENLKIAEACVRHGKRLIQFSTCEVYGRTAASLPNARVADPEDPIHGTFSEDTSEYILGPVSKHRWIYSCAKQLLERVLHAYGLEQGFNYTIIRPFNFIGPKIDFLPQSKQDIPRVFSFFMDALLNGTPMKLVNGGVSRRCYTYIDDAVECTYRIVQNSGGICDRQIFNIGSPDNEVSIRQMAETMREIYAAQFLDEPAPLPEIVSVPGEEFYGEGYDDSDRRIPNIAKARRLLGWEPRWNFRDALEATMRYYVTESQKNRVSSAAGNG